jgi:MtN3 and saliva related transmembrane protein
MNEPFAQWIGLAAGILTTVAFVPQVLKIYRSKSGRGVSMRSFLLFSAGIVLWLGYGWLIGSWPVILANIATLVLSAAIITLKLYYAGREPATEDTTAR